MEPNELKAIRAELNLAQGQLAMVLGVTRTTVSNWESGKTKPPQWLQLIQWSRLRQPHPVAYGHYVTTTRWGEKRVKVNNGAIVKKREPMHLDGVPMPHSCWEPHEDIKGNETRVPGVMCITLDPSFSPQQEPVRFALWRFYGVHRQ